jgi:hypothetical protein
MFVVMTTRADLLTNQIMNGMRTTGQPASARQAQRKLTLALALEPPQMLVRGSLAAAQDAADKHFGLMSKSYNVEISQLSWEMHRRENLPPYYTAEARYLVGLVIRYVIVECTEQWAGL